MFCFLHSQLHKTNMKTLFARHVQSWPLLSHITVPYIVTFSAACDVPATISTEQEQPYLLDMGLGGHRACLENFENRKFNSYRQSKHYFSVANTLATAPLELYGVTYMSLFLHCLGNAAWKKFVFFNRISWITFIVCTLYQMLRPFNRFRCTLHCQRDIIRYSITKTASGWEWRHFPSDRNLMMPN